MNNSTILHKIEITFWDRAIPLMDESRAVQKIVRESYRFKQNKRLATWMPAVIIASGGFGWGLGYLIGLMGALLF